MTSSSGSSTSLTTEKCNSKRPKIGLVVPALTDGGGVPAVARFIIKVISRSNFDFKIISLSASSIDVASARLFKPSSWLRGASAQSAMWEGQPITHVGAVGGELEFQRYKPRRVLTDVLADCDLIQMVCGSPAWANSVVGLGKPVALQVATRARVERRLRDARPAGLSGWWRKVMTEITDRLDDSALRSVDAIQVENPWMLEYGREISAGRDVDLRLAPPGIETDLFEPTDNRRPNQDPYILCVARLNDPRKNIGCLLEAYARLPTQLRADVRLVLAGPCGPPTAFWERADELGLRDRIEFVSDPSREAIVKLFQHASVFALSSNEEGLGIVLLEAMACGVPVVSTRSGGPDGIVTDGVDGYLVPLDDAILFAARLEYLLVDASFNTEMGVLARKTIMRRYDEKVAGDVFIEMWERMMAKKEHAKCAG